MNRLSRRGFLGVAPLALLGAAAVGCQSSQRQGRRAITPYEEALRGATSTGKGTIVVMMPSTSQTQEVWTGLSDELGRDYELVSVRVDSGDDDATVAEALRRHAPRAVVLMNNPTVAAYAEYQRKHVGDAFPPAIVAMTSFLDGPRASLLQATGVYYEVPLITVVTNLRKLITTPIERIGVVRRSALEAYVRREAELAAHEHIAVVEEHVGPEPNASELKRAIRRVRQRADALWVLNDDRLLTARLIADAWLPGVSERPWIPTLVGAAPLVSPQTPFGTFAVLPDHTALGVQVASLVFDLADSDWTLPPDARAQLPLSTTTSMDLTQAKERFVLRDGALTHVDRILR
jgi:hypothetical protein